MLFDLVNILPVWWIIWTSLQMPLFLLSSFIVAIGGHEADFITGGSLWFFWIVQLVYFYILSCLIVFAWDKLKEIKKNKEEIEN